MHNRMNQKSFNNHKQNGIQNGLHYQNNNGNGNSYNHNNNN